VPALSNFIQDEIGRRDWSIPEWAPRANLSVSNAYLIVRDHKDNVRQDTFEHIAASFSMTPAELMVAIGKGAVADSPRRVIVHATLRDVPDEQLDTVDRMLRSIAVEPAQRRSSGRTDRAAIRQKANSRQMQPKRHEGDNSGSDGMLPRTYQPVGILHRILRSLDPRPLVFAPAS
jgi:hypothetical protein